MSESRAKSYRIVDDATCLGCPCLCDDIGLVVEDDRIVEAKNACSEGLQWYSSLQACPEEAPTISGEPVSLDAALDRAAEILGTAKAPVIHGLDDSTIEAHRVLMAIADRLGAFVEHGGNEPNARIGTVGATLGEVKDRADVIVYAGLDPWPPMPRFRERYAEDSVGRFVPEGRAGRTVIRLGAIPYGSPFETESDHVLDHVVDFDPRRAATIYVTLRGIVNGVALESAAVEGATGVPLSTLLDLVDLMKHARYGAFIYGSIGWTRAASEAFLALVRDLNHWTRFVAIQPRHGTGGEAVRTWQAGFGGEFDLRQGVPHQISREGIFRQDLRGELDALLVVGENYFIKSDFPQVVIRPGRYGPDCPPRNSSVSWYQRDFRGDVCITTSAPGIDEAGTVSRFDGVMLPLRPPFAGRRVTQVDVLRGIYDRLKGHAR